MPASVGSFEAPVSGDADRRDPFGPLDRITRRGREEATMSRRFPIIVVFLVLTALVAAACGGSGGSGGGKSNPTLSISAPADGATTAVPFTVKVKSSVPLGKPDTGRHHVHIWFDGKQDKYTIGYSDRVQITDVSAGQHKMTVSLRNPNHSSAGVDKTVTVTVSGGNPAPTSSPTSDDYGY